MSHLNAGRRTLPKSALSVSRGRVDWEPAAKLFRFTRDKTLAIETPYTETDTVPPSQPLQALGLRVEAANCASGPRPPSRHRSEFDNVLLAP